MKVLDHKDAINRRLYEGLIIVETAIYRVSCLNRTILGVRYCNQARSAILNLGNRLLNSSARLLNSGNRLLNSGDHLLNSGNCLLNLGDRFLNSGDCLLNSGARFLNLGSCLLNLDNYQ